MHISFEHIKVATLPLLYDWFLQPHVDYWWQEPHEWEAFHAKWSERIQTGLSAYHTPWFGHIVAIHGVPIGYIQHFFVTAQQCHGYPLSLGNSVGLDFLIGEPAYVGKKLSTPILEQYLTHIHTNHPQITTVLIEPAYTNQRAIHVYEKVGFKRLKQYSTNNEPKLLMYKQISKSMNSSVDIESQHFLQ